MSGNNPSNEWRTIGGASVSIDCGRCSDPTVGMLVDSLVGMWNKRWCADEEPANDDTCKYREEEE